jgi:hypothetical protein
MGAPDLLVVIDDFDVRGPLGRPDEAHAVLIVDPNTVLPTPIAFQRFQTISGRHAQLVQGDDRIQLVQLSARDPPQRLRAALPGRLRRPPIEDIRSRVIGKRTDHWRSRQLILKYNGYRYKAPDRAATLVATRSPSAPNARVQLQGAFLSTFAILLCKIPDALRTT